MSEHDEEPIGTSGIEEAENRVPPWLTLAVTGLLIFFVVYIVMYFTGEQPSSAQFK
ncbi:MAG: cbb3-type cytochrome c oxidase N-terminal domain-containing protein [Planctomycetota bacterium]|nr:cbb3-type cytochrome c oxidase N-terminal domain-containing protein [Planctomycetota bacterium]